MNAARRGHTETAIALLASGADLEAQDQRGLTALAYSVSTRHLITAEALLNRGADVNATGRYEWYAPIAFAVRAEDSQLVELLLQYGVDVESFSARVALGMAKRLGDNKIIHALKQAGMRE